MKYNYLDADEAEQEFERRNKTLNYFSIMVSKKMKSSEEGEEGGPSAVPEPGGIQVKLKKEKKKAVDSGLVMPIYVQPLNNHPILSVVHSPVID